MCCRARHRLCRDEVHQDVILGNVESASRGNEVVIKSIACLTHGVVVLEASTLKEVYGGYCFIAAPRYAVVRAGGHGNAMLTIEVAEVAGNKETV